jgi:TetR/AcrR family transcriptional repressor of nem operon
MNKREALLNAAETRARIGGYSNFSFRELAAEVGIKSASVHYHFPTKEDLGAELAKRYTNNFLDALGTPSDLIVQGKKPVEVYLELFRHALENDRLMCLCGLFGAESDALPEKVKANTKVFFDKNIAWLEEAITLSTDCTKTIARNKALFILSLLEGSMMLCKVLQNNEAFSTVTEFIGSESF